MTKRVELTEELKNKIRTRCGNDVDFSSAAFYQARIVSTEPISQDSIYNKAQLARSTVFELEEFFNNDPQLNVTLQVMHNQRVLPAGRVVAVRAVDEPDGVNSALYGVFMVSNEHQDYINKLDNGIIDEVSISMLAKKLLCSECGFDLREASPEEQFMAFFFHECPKCEAELGGREGAHLNLVGVEEFTEVSLVTRGAARHAKILDSSKQLALAANNKEVKLKLSQLAKDLLPLNLNGKIINEEDTMKNDELLAKLQEISEELASFKASVEARFEEIAKKEEVPAEAEKDKEGSAPAEENPSPAEPAPAEAPVEAPVEEAAPAEDNKELEEAKAALSAAKAEAQEYRVVLMEEVNKVLVAAGKVKLSDEASLEDIKNSLKESKLTLAASIPVEGVAKAAKQNPEAKVGFSDYTANQLAAMKLKK